MANITDGLVYARRAAKMIWGNKLLQSASEIDSATQYSVDDFLHQNLLTFPNVFFNVERGVANILRVHIQTYGNPLYKPDMRLLLFNKNECDIAPVKNSAFNWGTVCKGEHLLHNIGILSAEFVDQAHNSGGGAVTYYSQYVSALLNLVVDNATLNQTIQQSNDLVGLLVCRTAGQFSADAWLKVGLEVELL